MCHLILALPVLGVAVFWFWPLSIAGPVYGVIFMASLAMYYLIMRAMRQPVTTGREAILHDVGDIVETRGRKLRVRVGSEIWNAESPDRLRAGDRVSVLGMEGLVLRVRRLGDGRGAGIKTAASG